MGLLTPTATIVASLLSKANLPQHQSETAAFTIAKKMKELLEKK